MSTQVRWTVADMEKLAVAFPGQRMELIEGELYNKMGQNPPHAYVISVLLDILVTQYGTKNVRVQLPVTLPGDPASEPEPDLVVTTRGMEHYQSQHPSPEDIQFLIEVADSSLDVDLTIKHRLYARHGVRQYILLDVPHRAVHIYTRPSPDGYDRMRRLYSTDTLEIFEARVKVDSLFPNKL